MKKQKFVYSNRGIRLFKKYKALSPMMRMIFAGTAVERYDQDHSLAYLMEDIRLANRVCHYLLVSPASTPNNMANYIRATLKQSSRPGMVLSYVSNALTYGENIVFRMSHLYAQKYHSLVDFNIQHPALIADTEELSKYTQVLAREDLQGFDPRNATHIAAYRDWVQYTTVGWYFENRRRCCKMALKDVFETLKSRPQPCLIASTNSGKRFIQEKYANADLQRV